MTRTRTTMGTNDTRDKIDVGDNDAANNNNQRDICDVREARWPGTRCRTRYPATRGVNSAVVTSGGFS